jgi:ABC-type antimicrobial peptide transport system permease subunit
MLTERTRLQFRWCSEIGRGKISAFKEQQYASVNANWITWGVSLLITDQLLERITVNLQDDSDRRCGSSEEETVEKMAEKKVEFKLCN